MPSLRFPKIAQLKSVRRLRERLAALHLDLPIDAQILTAAEGSPLAEAASFGDRSLGNRWCIHPMEGWDGTRDGHPTALTFRRWRHFGQSGAKLIWGGEAAAVRADGRANPHQIMATPAHLDPLRELRTALDAAHREAGFDPHDLIVGLQLTHSGRFSRPDHAERPEPRVMYHHPWLDPRVGIESNDKRAVLGDRELEDLVGDYVAAARTARDAGFDFVDIKACHGYLLHESLSAYARPGPFGGSYDNRTRLLRTIIDRVRREVPDLRIGVRLSLFDRPPFRSGGGPGTPIEWERDAENGPRLFGTRADDPLATDWEEPARLLADLQSWGVVAVNVSAGSPYYCPHVQRPAAFPPSDGYAPPEDPLAGAVRLLDAARVAKRTVPELFIVATGITYFQDFVPHVAQGIVRDRWCDAVGLGRMVLSYAELPADTLAGRPIDRKRICRTFSDCTTAPRNGLVSGCFPLDDYYKNRPEAEMLHEIKRRFRQPRS